MRLRCLVDHIYGEDTYTAGNVYEVEDGLAQRLLRDFGPPDPDPGSAETRRGRPSKFEPTTDEATVNEATVTEAPVTEVALCGVPVGNGTCVLPEGHAGAHRLTPLEASV